MQKEVFKKEIQNSAFSVSSVGLHVCTCVLVGSHWQPQRKGPVVRLLALCLYHYTFNGTKQESSCCPPPSPANKQRGSHALFTGRVSGNLHSCSV